MNGNIVLMDANKSANSSKLVKTCTVYSTIKIPLTGRRTVRVSRTVDPCGPRQLGIQFATVNAIIRAFCVAIVRTSVVCLSTSLCLYRPAFQLPAGGRRREEAEADDDVEGALSFARAEARLQDLADGEVRRAATRRLSVVAAAVVATPRAVGATLARTPLAVARAVAVVVVTRALR